MTSSIPLDTLAQTETPSSRLARNLPPELVLAAVAVSFSAPVIRWAAAPPLVTGAGRTLLAFLIALVPAVRALGRKGPEADEPIAGKAPWKALNLTRRDLLWASVAALALAVHFAAWIAGLDATSVASAVVLVNAHPLLVLGAEALWLRRRVRRREWGGAVLALVGVLVLAGGDFSLSGGRALLGDALSFLGAVASAAYVLAGARVRQRVPNPIYVAFLYAVCAFLLSGGALLFREPWPSLGHPVPAWTAFLILAVVPTTLGHTLVNRVLGYVRAGFVSVALLAEPVLAPVWAGVWFHEMPTWPEAIGGILAVVGMAVVLWPSGKGQGSDPGKRERPREQDPLRGPIPGPVAD